MLAGGAGVLLVAAVTGYWVLERADKHKGLLKQVGQVVGWVVIVSSLLGVACRVYALTTGKGGYCPLKDCPSHKFSCPFSPSSPTASPTK